MSREPLSLLSLIAHLKKLPGVGKKSAERFAFHLLSWPQEEIKQFITGIETAKTNIVPCQECGCLLDKEVLESSCHFCDPNKRDTKSLCILATPKEVYQFEESCSYHGLYHVLGTLLSPLNGCHPADLHLDKLLKRLQSLPVEEIIIALDSTIEGDATSLYLKQELSALNVRISRLAFGLPMGSSLDYVDGGTLSKALSGRQLF